MRTLEAPGAAERARRLRQRFRHALERPPRARTALARTGFALLALYWTVCLAVIAWGLDRLNPDLRADLTEQVRTYWGDRPFPNCAAAHAAGVYDIPSWSPAYTERQDGDQDGLACEPLPP